MKKTISMFLLLCVLLFSVAGCSAENAGALPDLSAYSDEEIVLLLDAVQAETVSRKIARSANLSGGFYVGGRDIPVGGYVLTAAGLEGQSGIVEIETAENEEGDSDTKLCEYIRGGEPFSAFVYIEEGDTIELPFSFTLTISCMLFE